MCEYSSIPEYAGKTCESIFDCCDCGGNNCGCRYCYSCNACMECKCEGLDYYDQPRFTMVIIDKNKNESINAFEYWNWQAMTFDETKTAISKQTPRKGTDYKVFDLINNETID